MKAFCLLAKNFIPFNDYRLLPSFLCADDRDRGMSIQ
jgi:hypothetical protein